jgi:hypothetical protein
MSEAPFVRARAVLTIPAEGAVPGCDGQGQDTGVCLDMVLNRFGRRIN